MPLHSSGSAEIGSSDGDLPLLQRRAGPVARPPSAVTRPTSGGDRTMPAAVLMATGGPLELREVAFPEPGPDEALVRVEAVGVCGTDLKLISGILPGTALPVIPGHEVSGVIERAPGEEHREGTRVACYLYESCGTCRWCEAGRDTLCPNAVRVGMERDGGLATHLIAARRNLLPFGDTLSFAAAAVSMDAVTTPWAALRHHARLTAGESVVIVGCGGLGSQAVQIAGGADARVAVVDPVESHRALGLSLGAELAVAPDDLGALRDWLDGGADIVLETSGRRAGFDVAVATVRAGGRIVSNGYSPGVEYGLDSSRLVLDEINVMGSRLASRESAREALAAVERGEVTPRIMQTLPLSEVNDALGLLASGQVEGRLVVTP